MGKNGLRVLLDIPTVLALAGRQSYERGLEYVAAGRVGAISASDEAIEATVSGSDPYAVRITATDGRLDGSCSCPMGESGAFCKHCVALALAWLEPRAERVWADRRRDLPSPRTAAYWPEDDWDEPAELEESSDPVGAFLSGLDHDELVEIVKGEMKRDDALRARIRSRAGSASTDASRNLRRALDEATAVHGYLHYAEVPSWAADVEDVADAIERAIGQGRAEAVIELAERGVQRVSEATAQSDDSDGYHGHLLRRFEQIHLAACLVATPDPVELARRLFKLELESEWDAFAGAAERYVDVLGLDGLAEYRRLAEEPWATVPSRAPDPDWLPPRQSHAAFVVTRMLESVARASGDVDELIAVMSRDRSSAYQFLELARVCRDAGRADEALDWAERGVEAFPRRTDPRLVEFLADAYLERDRSDDALALVWTSFQQQPELEPYQRLKRVAERTRAWDAVRPRALEQIRSAHRHPESAGTTLVAIHDREAAYDAAWAAVDELGCDRRTISRLAKRTEDTHPERALAAFEAEVSEVLQTADRRHYEEAIGLLRRIERISAALGRDDDFRIYAASVREENKRRPAFCSMFDATSFLPRLR